MSRKAQENLVAFVILMIFAATIWAASDYGPRARLVPIPIAVIGIILMLGQLVLQNIRSEKDLEIDLLELISRKSTGDHDPAAQTGQEISPETQGPSGPVWPRELAALGLVGLMVALFMLIGPLPTMLVFTTGYFWFSGHARLMMSAVYGFAATAAVYALFYLWLGVDMRQGLIDLSFGLW